MDDASRKSKVDEFIDWVYREYGEDMYQFFKCNYDGILDNKLQQPYGDFPRGMKLSKVLMKEFGLDAEDVRQKLSMLIQSNKVTGKLCLSIHPLDYLSASENNHGWRSCHALDGEYRAGNLSYMTDDCTIIAYLKSDSEPTKLPRFPRDVPWNDKKWRVYLHVDRINNIVYAGRQYPFHTDKGLELISEMIRELGYFKSKEKRDAEVQHANNVLDEHLTWADYKRGYVPQFRFHHWGLKGPTMINGEQVQFNETKFIVSAGRYNDGVKIVPGKHYIDNNSWAMNFNDVIQSHTYSPWMMPYAGNHDGGMMPPSVETILKVGGRVTCCNCGRHEIADSDTMLCNNCREGDEEMVSCAECGAVYPENEMHWTPSRGWICYDCYQSHRDEAPHTYYTELTAEDLTPVFSWE